MGKSDGDWRAFMQYLPIRLLLWIALKLPYERRVRFVGHVTARWIAPIAGWHRRIALNLAHVCPELSNDEVRRLQRAVPDNAGRSLIESFSGAEFVERTRDTPLSGPGLAPFLSARAAGRPVIFVTAHFGNYLVARAVLHARDHQLAGFYRPMRNRWFNSRYVAALREIGEPLFASDRKGTLGFVKHLAGGGIIALLIDVYTIKGAKLTFFGKSAPTAPAAAEWALRYGALVVPIYGIRQPDGLSFEVVLDAPIEHTAPEQMTQELNDSLEKQVREHMHQWFWIHRRWAKSPEQLGEAESP
ncbi:MAG: lauroyl acyltransferase [Pseudomonadota bacterium]